MKRLATLRTAIEQAGLFFDVWVDVSDDGERIRLHREDGSVELDSLAAARDQLREWRAERRDDAWRGAPLERLVASLRRLRDELQDEAIDRKDADGRFGEAMEDLPLDDLGLSYFELPGEGGYALEHGALVVRDGEDRLWAIDLETFAVASGEDFRDQERLEETPVPTAMWPHLLRGLDACPPTVDAVVQQLVGDAQRFGLPVVARRLERAPVRDELEGLVELAPSALRSASRVRRALELAIPTVRASELDAAQLRALLDHGAGEVVAYRSDARFEVGARVRHPTFGIAVVIEAAPASVVVQLPSGTKRLVHGR